MLMRMPKAFKYNVGFQHPYFCQTARKNVCYKKTSNKTSVNEGREIIFLAYTIMDNSALSGLPEKELLSG